MDTSKYIALFVEESKEHLQQLNKEVVAAESTADAEAINVDEIFRHLHSLKGMAASLDYKDFAELAHSLENLVSKIREGSMTLSREIVDLLLDGIDCMSSDIQSIEKGGKPGTHEELIEKIKKLDQKPPPKKRASKQTKKKTPQKAKNKNNDPPPSEDESIGDYLEIEIHIAPDCSSPTVRAYLVMKRLGKLSDRVTSLPSVDDVKAGNLERTIKVFIREPIEHAQVKEVLEDIPELETINYKAISASTYNSTFQPSTQQGTPEQALQTTMPPVFTEGKPLTAHIRVKTDVLDDVVDSLGEMFISHERLRVMAQEAGQSQLSEFSDELHRHIRHLYERVMSIRMTPLQLAMDKLPRLIREISKKVKKNVKLVVEGEDVEIDRTILESLDVPLTQIVRNCIDHGIEAPSERKKLKKPAQGSIRISAHREQRHVVVTIEDDGRGLDPAKIKAGAVKKGLIKKSAADQMDDRAAMFLVCLPGFSTAEQVSEISGRGVGMDVVRAKLENIGGRLDIASAIGKGTRFTLFMPLSLAIAPALIIEVAGLRYAIALNRILGTTIVEETPFRGGDSFYTSFHNELIIVRDLAELLGIRNNNDLHLPSSPAIVIEEDGTPMAFAVHSCPKQTFEFTAKPCHSRAGGNPSHVQPRSLPSQG
jgi:two-component system chemotaxis sensor kinase CheA